MRCLGRVFVVVVLFACPIVGSEALPTAGDHWWRSILSAPWTAFKNGSQDINPQLVEAQAVMNKKQGVTHVWINGGMAQWQQLTIAERETLAEHWVKYGKREGLFVIVHVGHSSIRQAVELAKHATRIKADAIAVIPSYLQKAKDLDELIDFIVPIAQASPLPFYYYHIPGTTGYYYNVSNIINKSLDRIPTWRGVKYVDQNLPDFQRCTEMNCSSCPYGKYDMQWANDPKSQAIPYGAKSFVLAENYYAPYILKVLEAYDPNVNDSTAAAEARYQDVKTAVRVGAAKDVMALLGVDLGVMRLPSITPSAETRTQQRQALESVGFFVDQPTVGPFDEDDGAGPVWVIAGGAVGGLLVIALVAAVPIFGVLLWLRGRNRRYLELDSLDDRRSSFGSVASY